MCVRERWSVSRGGGGGGGRGRSPNRGREKLALEYLKARRGGGEGTKWAERARLRNKEEGAEGDGERGARETREKTLLGFRC